MSKKQLLGIALVLAAGLGAAGAHAGNVQWSVGIQAPLAPGVVVDTVFGNAPRGYYAPPVVYAQPVYAQPVYEEPVYLPAPVYRAPRPVYMPAPVYWDQPVYAPRRIVYQPVAAPYYRQRHGHYYGQPYGQQYRQHPQVQPQRHWRDDRRREPVM